MRRNGRAGGLVAPREAARNAGRTVVDGVRARGRGWNARPPPPGRAVADRGTGGAGRRTDGGGSGGRRSYAEVVADGDRWIGGLGVRASDLGAYAPPPRRTGDNRRNLAAIFRDIAAQPLGNGAGGGENTGGWTADTEPVTEAGSVGEINIDREDLSRGRRRPLFRVIGIIGTYLLMMSSNTLSQRWS